MDTEFLNIGLASFVHCLCWANFKHKEFSNWNSSCSLKYKVSFSFKFKWEGQKPSTEILDVEVFLYAVFFMQNYKILVLILVG